MDVFSEKLVKITKAMQDLSVLLMHLEKERCKIIELQIIKNSKAQWKIDAAFQRPTYHPQNANTFT